MKTYKHTNGREFYLSSVYQVSEIWFCWIKWIDTQLLEKFYYDDISPIVDIDIVPVKHVEPKKKAAPKKQPVIKNDSKLQQALF